MLHKHSGMQLLQGIVTTGPRVGDSHHIRAPRDQRDLLPRAGNAAGVAEASEGFSRSRGLIPIVKGWDQEPGRGVGEELGASWSWGRQ